ncbi:MAG: DapH/DapD/GlmU-related protein [Spirochaetales bacterium]|nr:DapH/DapD/GlmU-related protein [Spirochaetales bacterium]
MKKVILIGGGGHALSLLEMLDDISLFAGYCDCKINEKMPIPYLGTDEDVLKSYSPNEYEIHHAVVYADKVNLELRKSIIEKFSVFSEKTIYAPTAIVSSNSIIGDGCAIFHKVVLNRCKLGLNSIINTSSIIEHDSELGNNVFVASGSIICGGVKIGNNVFIGAGSIIRDEITIADDVIIGMGSVVTKNITKAGIYIGNPASLKQC